MRNYLILLLVLLFTTVYGQDESESAGSSGIVGNARIGSFFRLPNDFGAEMNSRLRESENYSQIGTMVSAGAIFKMKNNLIVGLSGSGLFFPKTTGTRSEVSITGIGVGGLGGYTLIDNGRWFIYPHLSVGGYRQISTLDNSGSLVNQGDLYIPPGGSEELNAELFYFDIGGTIWRALTPVGGRYFAIGLSTGFRQSVFGTVWETSEGFNLEDLSDPTLSMFYFTLNIGGGSFK